MTTMKMLHRAVWYGGTDISKDPAVLLLTVKDVLFFGGEGNFVRNVSKFLQACDCTRRHVLSGLLH